MSDPISIQPLAASPGRFILLREEAVPSLSHHQAPAPRVRRYHLSRVGGRPSRAVVNPGPRQPSDHSHLRCTHD